MLAPRRLASDQQGQGACVPQCDSLIMGCLLPGNHGTFLCPSDVGTETRGPFEPRVEVSMSNIVSQLRRKTKRIRNFLFTKLSPGRYFLLSFSGIRLFL